MLQPRMAALSILSVALMMGILIAAEGGFAAFFSKDALIGFTVVTIALLVAAFFTNATLSSGEREDRANRWVIPALTLVSLVMAVAPPLCDRFDVLTFGGEGVRWLGVALYAIGGIVRLAPVFALGRRFSGLVAIQPGHRLKTDGLYSFIRHPSYLGLLTMCVGIPLVFRSLLALVIWAPILAILVARMDSEERLLSENFGAEYEAYRRRTWRLAPWVY